MIYSLFGKVVFVGKETIAIDLGNIAYEVFVSKPDEYIIGEERKIFTYEVLTQDDHYLCGFASSLEKEAFGSLIGVKGIGPKTALNALSETTPDELFKAISANNTAYLKKLPGIGPKAAAQIILDLKGKLVESDIKGNPKMFEEVRQALKSMGFKAKSIDDALCSINEPDLSTQQVLSLALKIINKK